MVEFDRLAKLEQRRLDPTMTVGGLNEVYKKLDESPAIKYAIGAMQPIDAEYTKNTYKESERVENQLTKPLSDNGIEVEYSHQGSVTNDTHIKAHSDIDTLVVHSDFVTVSPPGKVTSKYIGDPVKELKKLRLLSADVVRSRFPQVDVDDSGGKSVALEGGSLRRKIDLVFCNWWDTEEYNTHKQDLFRGIQVLDVKKHDRIGNKPFYHNAVLNMKDMENSGNIRKLIRLLKSLKYDSDAKNTLSSYDIAAVVYQMDKADLRFKKGEELALIASCNDWMDKLTFDQKKREGLYVPNYTRKIFCDGGANLTQLMITNALLKELRDEIEKGLFRSFKKLHETRVAY